MRRPLFMPIVQRELLRESRRRSHFLFRTVFAAALSGMIVWTLAHFRMSGAAAQRDYARLGTDLFWIWVHAMRYGLAVFAILRAAAMAEERGSHSMPLLRSTSMDDREIILGYFLSIMGRATILMLLTLPIITNVRSLGGFPMGNLFYQLASMWAQIAMAGALALLVAARCERMTTAAMMALLLYFGVSRIVVPPYASFLTKYAPASHLLVFFLWSILPRIVVVWISLRLATRFLGQAPVYWASRLKRFFAAIDRKFLDVTKGSFVLWKSGLGPCKGNPVLWRERAVSLVGRTDHMIRICYLSLAAIVFIPLILALVGNWEASTVIVTLGLIVMASLIAFICLVARPATAFPREYQKRSAAMLALTGLSAQEIIMGKYVHILRPIAGIGFIMIIVISVTIFVRVDVKWTQWATCGFTWSLVPPIIAAQIMYICMGTTSVPKAILVGGLTLAPWALVVAMEPRVAYELYWQEHHVTNPGLFIAAGASIVISLSLLGSWFSHGGFALFLMAVAHSATYSGIPSNAAKCALTAVLAPLVITCVLPRGRKRQGLVALALALGLLSMSRLLPVLPVLMLCVFVLGYNGIRKADGEAVNRLIHSSLLFFPVMSVAGLTLWLIWSIPYELRISPLMPLEAYAGLTVMLGVCACLAMLNAGCRQIKPFLKQNA